MDPNIVPEEKKKKRMKKCELFSLNQKLRLNYCILKFLLVGTRNRRAICRLYLYVYVKFCESFIHRSCLSMSIVSSIFCFILSR